MLNQDSPKRCFARDNGRGDVRRAELEVDSHNSILHHPSAVLQGEQDLPGVVVAIVVMGNDSNVNGFTVKRLDRNRHVVRMDKQTAVQMRHSVSGNFGATKSGYLIARREQRE